MLQITINNKEQDNIKAIQVDDYLVIVDKRSKLKKEDYVCSVLYGIGKVTSDNHENYKGEFPLLAEFLNKPNYFIPYNIDGSYCNDGKKIYKNDCFKIIASTKRIDKSIPLIVFKEKSVEDKLIKHLENNHIEASENRIRVIMDFVNNQAKSSNKKYIEEAVRLMQKFIDKVESGKARSKETYSDFKEFINSLNQLKLPETINLEFEVVYSEETLASNGGFSLKTDSIYKLKTTISTEEGDEIHITI